MCVSVGEVREGALRSRGSHQALNDLEDKTFWWTDSSDGTIRESCARSTPSDLWLSVNNLMNVQLNFFAKENSDLKKTQVLSLFPGCHGNLRLRAPFIRDFFCLFDFFTRVKVHMYSLNKQTQELIQPTRNSGVSIPNVCCLCSFLNSVY